MNTCMSDSLAEVEGSHCKPTYCGVPQAVLRKVMSSCCGESASTLSLRPNNDENAQQTILAKPKSVIKMSEAMDLLANSRFSGCNTIKNASK